MPPFTQPMAFANTSNGEHTMADNNGGGGGIGILGVVIGAVLVVGIGFLVLTQTGALGGGQSKQVDVNLNVPKP